MSRTPKAPKPWTGWAVIDEAHPDQEPFGDEDNRLFVFTSRPDAERALWCGFGDRIIRVEVRPLPRTKGKVRK